MYLVCGTTFLVVVSSISRRKFNSSCLIVGNLTQFPKAPRNQRLAVATLTKTRPKIQKLKRPTHVGQIRARSAHIFSEGPLVTLVQRVSQQEHTLFSVCFSFFWVWGEGLVQTLHFDSCPQDAPGRPWCAAKGARHKALELHAAAAQERPRRRWEDRRACADLGALATFHGEPQGEMFKLGRTKRGISAIGSLQDLCVRNVYS